MIATIAALLVCAGITAHRYPDTAPWEQAAPVCVEIGQAARAHGVPLRLALAVGYHESRWRYGLVSSAGAVGPMQVRAVYHCAGGVAEGCDLVEAGVAALGRYLDEEGAVMPALCRYATGTAWSACGYGQRVLATSRVWR